MNCHGTTKNELNNGKEQFLFILSSRATDNLKMLVLESSE